MIRESHGKGYVGVNYNHAQMVQWDRSDYDEVNKYHQMMNQLSKEIYYFSELARRLRTRQYWDKNFSDRDKVMLDQTLFVVKEKQDNLNSLIDNLEGECYRYKQADKKNGFILSSAKKVEPQKIVIKENSLVNPALVVYAKQIANQSTEEFRYIASGEGTLPTKPNQNALQNENSRLDIFINGGFRNPNGDVVREGVIFPPGLADATITEFGSFTSPLQNTGDMQWRNVIEEIAEYIEHDQGATFYSIAHVTILQINYIE